MAERCAMDPTCGVKGPCPECKGTGTVPRKAWAQVPSMEHTGIHPAILARRPVYKTIVYVPCPRGCKKEVP